MSRLRSVDPVDALSRLGGVARAQDLLVLTTRKRLRTAVATGRVLHPRQGRFALPTARPALALAAQVGGHASHLCAAAVLGWEVAAQPDCPQVVLPPGVTPPAEVHAVQWSHHHVRSTDSAGLSTGPSLTALMCARDLPFEQALAVVDSGLRRGDLDRDALARTARRWPTQVRRVVDCSDARAANPFESVLRAHAIEAGARVIPQYEVRAGGLTLHPDLVDPFAGLVIEADSWGFHASRWDHERDCRRYNALVATDWRVLRFTYEQTMGSGVYVRATIERALALA